MKVLIVGAGPAGLTLAYLLKSSDPARSVQVIDRRRPSDHVGWGVTVPPGTLDVVRYPARLLHRVGRAVMRFEGRSYVETPVEYHVTERDALLEHLTDAVRALGVELRFGANVEALSELPVADHDLVVGADGANSVVRRTLAERFAPTTVSSDLRYAWLSTPKLFGDLLPRIFVAHRGAVFVAWGYQHSATASTLIVESTPAGLEAAGLSGLTDEESCRRVAEMLAPELDGEPVLCGPSFRWLTFELLKSRRWVHENVVLIGDAAHTSHFSRGFGTHLAVGDARCLARHLNGTGSVGYALEAFERERRPEVARHQVLAASSSNFYRSVIHAYERGTRSAIQDAIDQVERETGAAAPPSAPS